MPPGAVPLHVAEFDKVNLRTYGSRGAVHQYESATGWLEPGERASIERAANAARDGAILDIGVGGGRTTALLLKISSDYRGIDYCPGMVLGAQRRYPALSFRQMDARQLVFADDSFHLVVFSYNGIDSVDLGGRLAILHEVHRVLRPDGHFVFSSLNRQGAAHAEHWPDLGVFHGAEHSPLRLLRGLARLGLGGINWLRFRHIAASGDDVAISTISAHNFGLITLFMSVAAQVGQLRDCGFTTEAIFAPDGRQIACDGSVASNAPWCHFVARKYVSEP